MADMNFYSAHPILDESVSNVTATNSVDLGVRAYWLGEEYVYCYNAGGADIYPKYGVKLVTGASGYSIANTSLTNVTNYYVGVCKHSTITAGSYGWIMTKGFTKILAMSNITGDYVAVCPSISGQWTDPTSALSGLGTFFIQAHGITVNTGAGGSFYAFVHTGA